MAKDFTIRGKGPAKRRLPQQIQLEVGRRIRNRRRELGISLKELASRARMNRLHLGEIERGMNNVRLETMIELTRCLDTTFALLFRGLEESAERKTLPAPLKNAKVRRKKMK